MLVAFTMRDTDQLLENLRNGIRSRACNGQSNRSRNIECQNRSPNLADTNPNITVNNAVPASHKVIDTSFDLSDLDTAHSQQIKIPSIPPQTKRIQNSIRPLRVLFVDLPAYAK